MKIEIPIDSGEKKLHLSNEDFDNLNFIDMWLDNEPDFTVSIDELYHAVKTLYDIKQNTKNSR